jgi:hypothetical protein
VQTLAEPGTVLVTARVQRQVAGLFVAEERGSHELKGVSDRVTLFRLVRASGGGRRSGQRRLTPLVGREEEIAMLMRRWERARQGDGQLVLIVGEPGLGKSRLIEEFHARLREVPHTWAECNCSQLLQNTPLHPIADWGRQRFGGSDVPAEQRLADLENSLAQIKLDPVENAALLAPLLDIPMPQQRAPVLPPEELRRRQLAALTNWVMAGARAQPAVVAFEICNGPIRPRSTCCAALLNAVRWRLCSCCAARVSPALGRAFASRDDLLDPNRPPSGAAHG